MNKRICLIEVGVIVVMLFSVLSACFADTAEDVELAIFHAQRRHYPAAFRVLDSNINPDTILCKAKILAVYMKDYNNAIATVRQLLADYPNSDVAKTDGLNFLAFIAYSLENEGKVDEAVGILQSSLPANATNEQKAANLQHIAHIYFEGKRFNDAISVFDQLCNSTGLSYENQARAEYTRAYCYKKLDMLDIAKNNMQLVIDRYPNSSAARDAKMMLDAWAAKK